LISRGGAQDGATFQSICDAICPIE
jgi:hypothetical protein